MELRYEPRAVRALKKIGELDRATIVAALKALAAGNTPNADLKKLVDVHPMTWRLRVGRFRVLYRRIDGVFVVVDVDDRKDVHR